MGVLIDSLYWSARLDLTTLDKDMSQARRKLSEGSNTIQNEIKTGLGNTVALIGGMMAGAFSIAAIGSFIKGMISVRSEFEKYEAVLTNTLGSGSRAQMALQNITDFAAKTPFQVTELTSSFVKLANQGFEPTLDEMRKLGDLASSTGKGFDQLTEGILDATMGQWERMKEFGIKASVEGDKVTATFKGQATSIDNTADSIREYILSLGDMKGVSGSMEAISKTLGGQLSNLADSWDQLLNNLGGESSGVIYSVISWLSDFIKTVDNATASVERLQKGVDLKQIESQTKLDLEEIQMLTASYAMNGMDYDVANKKATDFITQNLQKQKEVWERELERANAEYEARSKTGKKFLTKKARDEYYKSYYEIQELTRKLAINAGVLENLDKAGKKDDPKKAEISADVRQKAYAKQLEAMKKKFEEFNAFARTFGLDKAQKAFSELADGSWRAYLDRLAKKETDPELMKIIAVNLAPLLADDKLQPIKRKNTPFVPYANPQLIAHEKKLNEEMRKHAEATREAAENVSSESMSSEEILDHINMAAEAAQELVNIVGELGPEFDEAKQGLADIANILQSKSIGEGVVKLGLTLVKDWVQYQKMIKDNNLQMTADQIAVAFDRLNNQLERANQAFAVDKVAEYKLALVELHKAAEKIENDIQNQRKNERGPLHTFEYETTSIEQMQEVINQLNYLYSSMDKKGKQTADDRIKQLNQWIDLKKQEKEIQDSINEVLTGTTAQTISDEISDGFDKGLSSVEDFSKSANETIRNALQQAFKATYIDKEVQKWYDFFAKLSEGGLTKEEAEQAKQSYKDMTDAQRTRYEAEQQMWNELGLNTDPTEKKQAGLAGSIKGITEETADVLAGQVGAIRINIMMGLEVAQWGLVAQRETAVNTRRLEKIETYLSAMVLTSPVTKDRANGR